MSGVLKCGPGCCDSAEAGGMRLNFLDNLIEWHRAGYRRVVPYNATAAEVKAAATELDNHVEEQR